MKALLLAYLLAVGAAPALAQQAHTLPLDSTTHKITYSAVVQVPGASMTDLSQRAMKWLAANATNLAVGVMTTNSTSGTLTGRIALPFTGRAVVGSMQCILWRQVAVTVKEGRAKYEFTDFQAQPYAVGAGTAPPNSVQQKLTPAEAYLNRGNSIYYTKQGQPKAFVSAILGAVEQQGIAQAASLKAALLKANDF